MDNDQRTMYDLVKNAVECQDACNLSGVVHSFSEDISRLRTLMENEEGFSTTKLNCHPVSVMYASKISSLVGLGGGGMEPYSYAYNWCKMFIKLSLRLLESRK